MEDVRLLFKSEQFASVKQAPKLTAKACLLTKLEHQNVHLALKIFNDQTAAALQIQNSIRETDKSQTHDLSKSFTKGKRLIDDLSLPLIYNDSRFTLLSRIADWVSHWKELPGKYRKLTPQTFTSLHTAVIVFLKSSIIWAKIVDSITFSVLCCRKIPLNIILGLYRMLLGAQYQVTACQIYESERRLKLSSILKVFSKQSSVNCLFLHFHLTVVIAENVTSQVYVELNIDRILPVSRRMDVWVIFF